MKFLISIILALTLSTILFTSRQKEIRQLTESQQLLEEEVREVENLKQENAALETLKIDKDEVTRLRGNKGELLDLRSRMTDVWSSDDRSIENLNEAIRKSEAEAESIEMRTEAVRINQQIKQAESIIKYLWGAASPDNRKTTTSFPSSMDELEHRIQSGSNPWFKNQLSRRFAPDNSPYREKKQIDGIADLTMDDFEFIPYSRKVKTSDRNAALIRQSSPLQHPEKGWLRMYILAGGKELLVTSDSGDFSEWESKHGLQW